MTLNHPTLELPANIHYIQLSENGQGEASTAVQYFISVRAWRYAYFSDNAQYYQPQHQGAYGAQYGAPQYGHYAPQ
jgi:hypothetical protein